MAASAPIAKAAAVRVGREGAAGVKGGVNADSDRRQDRREFERTRGPRPGTNYPGLRQKGITGLSRHGGEQSYPKRYDQPV